MRAWPNVPRSADRATARFPCYRQRPLVSGDIMAKKTVKRRGRTKDDVRELKSLARQKTPAPKIARKLKRTEGAIRQKALALGISLNSRR